SPPGSGWRARAQGWQNRVPGAPRPGGADRRTRTSLGLPARASMPGEHARLAVAIALIASLHAPAAWAGAQMYEPLSARVRSALSRSINHETSVRLAFANPEDGYRWLATMSRRLEKRIPDAAFREELLKTVHYEATRAGLDPQLVLGVIQVESGFRQYAVS